jgi:hypothetical protein
MNLFIKFKRFNEHQSPHVGLDEALEFKSQTFIYAGFHVRLPAPRPVFGTGTGSSSDMPRHSVRNSDIEEGGDGLQSVAKHTRLGRDRHLCEESGAVMLDSELHALEWRDSGRELHES